MKILSGLSWQTAVPAADNLHSLFIKQFDSKKGPLLMALVCSAAADKRPVSAPVDREQMVNIGGYFCEEMRAWFEDNYLGIILKTRSMAFIKNKLLKEQRRINKELGLRALSFALLISFRKEFITMQQGEAQLYSLKRRLKDMGADGRLKSASGHLRPGMGFLLCSESFTNGISEQQMFGALRVEDLRDEQLINKRLAGIVEYATSATKRQAAKQSVAQADRAAIYICIKR